MVALPGLMMDSAFQRMYATEAGRSVAEVKEIRTQLLQEMMAEARPDVLIIELYPFGRKAFRFELDPVLDSIRNGSLPPCRVICSLRDILVEKADADAYERRVVDTLNRGFDALWVHADPRVVRLEETFSRVSAIAVPIVYTGFIAPKPPPGARERIRGALGLLADEPLVVASAGGGKVGGPLLRAAAAAFERMGGGARLEVFTGPFMPEADVRALEAMAGGKIRVSAFTPDFLSYLAAADLSVSMAGYNTCMNVLAAGCQALMWPFSQNREQRFRAERLAAFGDIRILADEDLSASRMADLMSVRLVRKHRGGGSRAAGIDLDGAGASARWLAAEMDGGGARQ
jgi:predicted glycosyltransferase